MNYTYDIYLNLNKNLYDFFDWNKKDNILHIKKMPIIRLNHEIFIKCISNKIKIDNELLKSITNKAEIWNFKNEKINCILLSDTENVIAIEFDSNGYSKRKSYLMIDEEIEILETISNIKEKDFKIDIIKKDNLLLNTRKQLKEKRFIANELKKIEPEKLEYIFFECFGKKEKDLNIIIKKLKNIKENSKIYKKLYDILKITSTQKN